MGGYIGVQSAKLLQVTYFISGYTDIVPGLFSIQITRRESAEFPRLLAPLSIAAPGEENPSRPFKLSPEHPL